MTPLQALIKNIGMLVVFFVLNKYYKGWELNKKYTFYISVIFIAIMATPFILNAVALNYSEAYLNKPPNNYELKLDLLYNNATLSIPPKKLSKGKHIIAFMSLTCPHCRIAAKKIRIIADRNNSISFYFVLNGEDKNLKSFFEDTHTSNMPYCILNGKNFVYLAGTTMPRIYLINNSMVQYDVNYIDLNQKEIEKWTKNSTL
jgi:thiol-disulfide isomerase/thioredoxin